MNTVILEIDEQIIDIAKDYAQQHGQSLSQLVETYLKSLTTKQSNLLCFANCIEASDLILMSNAIEQECGNVDLNEW